MFLRPAEFRGFLSRNNYIDEIYDALAQDDTSDVVMAALHILRNTNSLPPMSMYKTPKNKEKSTLCRNEGNNAYVKGHYQRALGLYNEALLFAPNNSREMKLAYSNRSAVFHKLGAWTACYNDINRCFDMGCPSEIEVKLNKRRNDALPYLTRENFSKTIMNEAARKCIDPSAMRGNTQIPCASYDIKVVTSAAMPKVIAATNIKAGAVLASEQAYVSYNNASNSSFSCHFCQKKELNLIPCDGCCFALFCDENCKNKCMKQYHENECKIMDAIMQLCWGHMPNLMVKAFLKLRSSCKSWEELIAASYNMGISRIKSSSIQEVYDTNNKFSVLCFKDDKTFVHGDLYNACFVVAAILHYLEDQIPAFLPKSTDKKQQAMRASARIMMFMAVYLNPLHIIQAQTVIRFDKSNYGTENFGLFPFIAKLKNSCNPNSIIANNNNKLVLIALGPIKSGEELTVSYLWHKQDTLLSERLLNIKTFIFYGTVCSCKRCSSSEMNDDKEVLSKYQKKYFSQLDLNEIESRLKNIEINHVYSKLLKALTVLSDVPNSEEYIKIYSLWRRCMFFFETIWSDNNILDYNTE